MAETIAMVFNIIILAFVVLGMFFGLIRGFKKTLSRGLFLLITSIITMFVTLPIVNMILKIPFNISMDINGTLFDGKFTILEIISTMIEGFLGKNFVMSYPEFANALVSIPLIVINSIIYVIFFWIFKYLLFPINAIFTKIFFKDKKRKEALGFNVFSDGPEYPNSDKIIEPLMDIYEKTNQEYSSQKSTNLPTGEKQVGLFIQKEDEIKKEAPTATAVRTNSMPLINPATTPKKESRKEKKRREKKEKKALKPKKRRLLGALLGGVVGLIITFNTMVPVYGILNIINTNNNIKFQNLAKEEISLSIISGGLSDEILEGYEKSKFSTISKILGLNKLGLVAFDQVTSVKINSEKVVLRDDINSLVKTLKEADSLLGEYKELNENGLKNITQEQLTMLINGIDEVINTAEEVKMVDSLGEYLLPLSIEYIVYNEIQLSEDQMINDLIIDTLKSLAKNNRVEIIHELQSIVELAKYINDQELLIKIVTNDFSDIFETVYNLDDNFGTEFSEKLLNLNLISDTLPNIINIGLTIFDKTTDFGYVTNNASAEELKIAFTNLITNMVDVAKTLSEDTSYYVTEDSLVAIGNLLNTFRNSKLFHLDTYNNLVDYAIKQVKTATKDMIPENFQETFNAHILENIDKVANWKTEMTNIKEAIEILHNKEYGILGEVVENKELREGYSINIALNEPTIANLGKALDKLEKSILLGGTITYTVDNVEYNDSTVVSIMKSLFAEIKSTFDLSEDSFSNNLSSIIQLMSDNLVKSNHISNKDSSFWEEELTKISPLIINIYDMIKLGNFDISIKLGESLDKASSSVILGHNSTLQLMGKLINIIKDELLGEDYVIKDDNSMDDQIYNLLTDIQDNLLSNELYEIFKENDEFWETEITPIITLKDIANEVSTIDSIDSASAIAIDLDQIYTSRIIPSSSLNNIIATVLKQLKSDSTNGVNGSINNLIDNIATDITTEGFFENIEKENFWQIEFKHIKTLMEIKFDDEDDYIVTKHLSQIGNTLDSVAFGNNSTRASYLITEFRVRELLATAIDELNTSISNSFSESMQNTITSVLTNISTNIYNSAPNAEQVVITSFEIELGHLQTLANLEISSDLFTYTNDTATLTNKLQSLGKQLDSISYKTITRINNDISIISYNAEDNSSIISRDNISSIVKSAFNMAKTTEEDTNAEVMYNNLITQIQDSIDNINNNNKVISWERELSYVATLINLNSGETFSIENASEKVGMYIDQIGFNTLSNGNFADIQYNANNEIIGSNTYSYKENPEDNVTKYYNSVIISRIILKTTISSLLNDFKISAEGDSELTFEEEISNELIDNLNNKISINNTSSNLYNAYTQAFADLNSVKTQMEEMADSVNDKNIIDINGAEIDTMLQNFQDTIVCGTKTTRKIAILIIDTIQSNYADIYNFENTEAGSYLQNLETYYTNNINSESQEEYSIENSTSTYNNPFAVLISLSTTL